MSYVEILSAHTKEMNSSFRNLSTSTRRNKYSQREASPYQAIVNNALEASETKRGGSANGGSPEPNNSHSKMNASGNSFMKGGQDGNVSHTYGNLKDFRLTPETFNNSIMLRKAAFDQQQ